MIDPSDISALTLAVQQSIDDQRGELQRLREMVRPLRSATRRIMPRSTTAISIVGTDGGNNRINFDPFYLQVVRVADSSEQDHCLEFVTPNTDLSVLVRRHFFDDGRGKTPLGRMMVLLKQDSLHSLSSMIPSPPKQPQPSWVQVYRELQEWAVLLDLVINQDFATDTVILRDGWLRTKVFGPGLFQKYRAFLEAAIQTKLTERRRRVYVAAVLKRSKVLQKFQLAMMLEGVLRTAYPCYVEVPGKLQEDVFRWTEIIGGDAGLGHRDDANNMVAGEMFFVKFGNRPHDPVWVVDLLVSQTSAASTTFGYLLADALNGFPVPFFPMSLQRAHEHAAISGFDADILEDKVSDAVRHVLGDEAAVVDAFELTEAEVGKN